MNCYYAPGQPAVGICKSCGKGLSAAFASDVGNGLACKDRCEDRVRTINLIIDNNQKILMASNTQLRRNTIFLIVSGLLFMAFGCFTGLPSLEPLAILLAALGLVFIIRGITTYTRAARYPLPETNTRPDAAR